MENLNVYTGANSHTEYQNDWMISNVRLIIHNYNHREGDIRREVDEKNKQVRGGDTVRRCGGDDNSYLDEKCGVGPEEEEGRN